MSPNIADTDKAYWHRYIDFYEPAFDALDRVSRIVEFGVFKGDSIRWLAGRFPDATIVGCDIVSPQPGWPVSPRIHYATLDQGSIEHLRTLYQRIETPVDLVIEDGSHEPPHQRNCLVESLPHVRRGGLYILEDIQTSHPAHPVYRRLGNETLIGPLHLLLAIEHLKSTGAALDDVLVQQLSTNSLFTADDVRMIGTRVQGVKIYRRATLPLRCYQCGQSDRFDFGSLRCACGTDLYDGVDSMSAIVRV